MNVLIIILMGLIVVLLVVIAIAILKIPPVPKGSPFSPELHEQIEETRGMGKSLREMAERMRDRDQTEQDRELVAYAEKKKKHQAVLNPLAGLSDGDERIHQTNPKAEKILIPENLSAEERQVLKDFFDL